MISKTPSPRKTEKKVRGITIDESLNQEFPLNISPNTLKLRRDRHFSHKENLQKLKDITKRTRTLKKATLSELNTHFSKKKAEEREKKIHVLFSKKKVKGGKTQRKKFY